MFFKIVTIILLKQVFTCTKFILKLLLSLFRIRLDLKCTTFEWLQIVVDLQLHKFPESAQFKYIQW